MPRRHILRRTLYCAALTLLLTGSQNALAKAGYLGIQMQELNEALLEALDLGKGVSGVLVADVVEGSAAATAGLARGDVIVSIGGESVASVNDIQRRVRAFDAGEKVKIKVVRSGKKKDFEVTLGEAERVRLHTRDGADFEFREAPGIERMFFGSRPTLGVELRELNEDLGGYFGTKQGLLVLDVVEDSAAAKAGLRAGDVLQSADDEALGEISDLHAALEEKEEGDTLALKVLREKKQIELSATIEARDERGFGNLMRMHEGDGPMIWRAPGRKSMRLDGGGPRSAPRVFLHGDDEDGMREEIEALREQLEELRSEVQKLRKG